MEMFGVKRKGFGVKIRSGARNLGILKKGIFGAELRPKLGVSPWGGSEKKGEF